MPSIWDILAGAKFFIGMAVSGFITSYLGGRILDWMMWNLPKVCTTFTSGLTICADAGIGTKYDVSSQVAVLINLFYAICYGMAFIGLIGLVLSLVRRTRQDVMLDTANPMHME